MSIINSPESYTTAYKTWCPMDKIKHFSTDPKCKDPATVLNKISGIGWEAITMADNTLLDSHEFMVKALKIHPYTLDFASPRLKSTKEFALEAMTYQPDYFQFLPLEICKDDDVMRKIIPKSTSAGDFVYKIYTDTKLLLKVLLLDGRLLYDVPRTCRTKEMVDMALKSPLKPHPDAIPDEFK